MRRGKHYLRSWDGGFTLIEMLASALIIGLVGAGIAGLVMLNGMTEIRMSNKVDSLNAARTAIESIARDVRMARNLGDIFGAIDAFDLITGSDTFPGPNNPVYFSGVTPASFRGWPGSPWPAGPAPGYTLSNQCLIVQIPTFDINGFPMALPQGFGHPPLAATNDDVDTLVYLVLQDPASTAANPTFMLQVAGFPGQYSTISIASNPPKTILRGIVGPTANAGPVSVANPPVVFQFLDKTPLSQPQSVGSGAANANLTGVLVQFQVLNQTTGTTAPAVVGIKSEVYLRNNSIQTVTVTTDQIEANGG